MDTTYIVNNQTILILATFWGEWWPSRENTCVDVVP